MTTPNIAVIISTTRASRWGKVPADWITAKIAADGRMNATILDLAEFDLPLFDEMASNRWMPSSDPKAVAWQEELAKYDGYVFVTAEYNHSISGALKNALDQAFKEWVHKPAAAVGYGGVGAARAIEHLRGITTELRMVNVGDAVHIGGNIFMETHPLGGQQKPLSDFDAALDPSVKAMLDELFFWVSLTKDAK
ncbi:NADPH-dependent FMN reductase [Mesobacterium pallidum]|uniref:NADPH-dependent FMN reductase n=1 Tax=Mesobacterium pallidum TaxID=2872037 RepID=UPI001EE308CA|nr:NAD(P)H-dependent oxidoreductase [Mesobacterium pallidum]